MGGIGTHARKLVAATVAVLAVAVLAAAAGVWWALDDGPLGDGGGFGMCTPATVGERWTFGEFALHNRGDSPITVTKVQLINPRHVEVVDAVLVPINRVNDGYFLVGTSPGYPPAAAAGWARRIPAVGASVPPTQDQPSFNLVLGLTVRQDSRVKILQDATFDATEVTYRSGVRRYTWRSESKVTLRVASPDCSDVDT